MVTKEELLAKLVREDPARLKAEARQEAYDWFLENIEDVVTVLKEALKPEPKVTPEPKDPKKAVKP